jgi:Family of unknown function (DUF6214)
VPNDLPVTHTFFDGRGRAEYLPSERVPVGNRQVPQTIVVSIRGGSNQPDYQMKIEVRRGVPQWTEVTLRARPYGAEVRDKDLSVVRLDTWLQQIVAMVSTIGGSKPQNDQKALTDIGLAMKGRPRISREHLKEVAEIYRAHIDSNPTEKVAAAFGKDRRTAGRYVRQARDAGLLPPTSRGKRNA